MKKIIVNVYEETDVWSSNYVKEFDSIVDAYGFLRDEAINELESEVSSKEANEFADSIEELENALDTFNEKFQAYAEKEEDKEFVKDLCIKVNDIIDAYDELQDFLSEEDR